MQRTASLPGVVLSEFADRAPKRGAAGVQLVVQMRPALFKYFSRKCRNPAEAEDLTHDVLVRMLARCGWQSGQHAKHCMYRAAVNRWLDRQRRALTRGTNVEWDDNGPLGAQEMSPERVLGGEQELRRIEAALRQLPDRTRQVLLLVRLEGMRQARVAEALGISASCVERHLCKALAHLARAIAPS